MDGTFDPEKLSADFDQAHADFQAIPLHPKIVEWVMGAADELEKLAAAGLLSPIGQKLEDAGETLAAGAAGVAAGSAVTSAGAAPLAPLAASGASAGVKLALDHLRAELEARAQTKLGGAA